MPEGYNPVLVVYREFDETELVYTAIWDNEDDEQSYWRMFGYANHEIRIVIQKEIIYWMPLPQPPK
jgi:hypothetical protein